MVVLSLPLSLVSMEGGGLTVTPLFAMPGGMPVFLSATP